MRSIVLAHEVDWDGFRAAARSLALEGVAPEQVTWTVSEPPDLFTALDDGAARPRPTAAFTLPRVLVDLAQTLIQAREPERLHTALQPDPARPSRRADPAGAGRRSSGGTRDPIGASRAARHRHHARPHQVPERPAGEGVRHVVGSSRSISSSRPMPASLGAASRPRPGRSYAVPRRALRRRNAQVRRRRRSPPGLPRRAAGRDYFGGVGGAAMSQKHWRNLPEAAAIPELTHSVEQPVTSSPRSTGRTHRPAAAPDGRLALAAAEAAGCRRCHLWQSATQTVFGEGPAARRSCWWASSRATRRISPAGRSSGRPGRCWTGAGRGRLDRAPSLRHQCGEALQVRAARQAAHPPEARRGRDRGLPLWLETSCAGCAGARGADGRHRRARGAGPRGDDRTRARQALRWATRRRW